MGEGISINVRNLGGSKERVVNCVYVIILRKTADDILLCQMCSQMSKRCTYYTTLHFITLHDATLHYSTLHWTGQH